MQVIDKSGGKYKVAKTIGSSSDELKLKKLVEEAQHALLKTASHSAWIFKNIANYAHATTCA